MYGNGGSLVEKDGDSFKVTVNSPENVATLERFVQANNEVMPKAIWAGGTTAVSYTHLDVYKRQG